MSRLFKLKEWLTIPDTAKYLSVVLGEEVTEADVLRLALDRHLKLSINFVNYTKAKRGMVVTFEETKWIRTYPLEETDRPIIYGELLPEELGKLPPLLRTLWDEVSIEERNKSIFIMTSERIDIDRFLNLTDEVETIKGVWDLPLIGAEKLDVEHKYQILTNGPEVTLQNINGCFVQKNADEIFQLQESFDNNEYQSGSLAALEELKEKIVTDNIGKREAEKLLQQHKEARKIYLSNKENRPKASDYYPSGGLPHDCVWIVRTAELKEFEQKIADANIKTEKSVKESSRKMDNLLRTITAIAIDDYGYVPNSERSNAPQEIVDVMSGYGVTLDAKTVRNWLKDGASLMPSKINKD